MSDENDVITKLCSDYEEQFVQRLYTLYERDPTLFERVLELEGKHVFDGRPPIPKITIQWKIEPRS